MEVVGDFEFGSLGILGSGAFAAVFKGRHVVNTDCIVAVKKIKKSVLPDLSSKEIKILKELTQLHHENVVNLLDCQDGPEFVYLIMEYCNGGTLADYMQARGVLGETTIGIFFCQIAEAMKALHGKGIVHRDLKPHNILLCHSGKPNPLPKEITVKIADFGFARFLSGGVMAGTICGSPLYMAPEILVSGRYDAKADLWSIAVIVYQCLVGRPPFPAASIVQLQKLYEQNPDVQPIIPSNTSPELSNLLTDLLKINPRKRMNFDVFFNHSFFKQTRTAIKPVKSSASLASLSSDVNVLSSSPLRNALDMDKIKERKHQHRQKQQIANKVDPERCTGVKPGLVRGREKPHGPSVPSRHVRPQSPDLDDFVIVPDFLPFNSSDDYEDILMTVPSIHAMDVDSGQSGTDGSCSSLDQASLLSSPTNLHKKINRCASSSPMTIPRNCNTPSSSRPISIPCQLYARKYVQHTTAPFGNKNDNSSLPRAISVTSVESMSPPTVQFTMGTPPSGSCSRCGSCSNLMAYSSRSATPCSFDGRRMSYDSPPSRLHSPLSAVHPTLQGPVSFVAPEFEERTLMSREHNDVMLKLEFTRDLSSSLIQLARSRSSPLTESVIDDVIATVTSAAAGSAVFVSQRQRNLEQLLLYMRALELLGSALSVARSAISTGQLQPTTVTRQVLRDMNAEYQQCLQICKYLSKCQSLADLDLSAVTAVATTDKLIYCCAIEMCQSAVMDELLGEMNECCRQYQIAYLLLHSLVQQANDIEDRKQLNKYKDGVEKRLMVLFNHGFINAKFMTG